MRNASTAWLLACLALAGCHGGERSRPKNPEPARMPFSPNLPLPSLARERPPPPAAPPDALRAEPEGLPRSAPETAPEREPPAGQLGSGQGER
jgi:hypothetical protein